MLLNVLERGRWLARNVLPHEPLIRARLGQVHVADLDVEDVIQEMYARLLALPSLESIRFPRQYAIQTAKSIVVDHVRRSRVIPITSTGSIDRLNVAIPEATAEQRLEFQGEIQEIANALAQLPIACRETLILRRIEGLSQKETARRLKVSEKSVEHYMSRGICLLSELFGRGGKGRVRASSNSSEEVVLSDEIHQPRD